MGTENKKPEHTLILPPDFAQDDLMGMVPLSIALGGVYDGITKRAGEAELERRDLQLQQPRLAEIEWQSAKLRQLPPSQETERQLELLRKEYDGLILQRAKEL